MKREYKTLEQLLDEFTHANYILFEFAAGLWNVDASEVHELEAVRTWHGMGKTRREAVLDALNEGGKIPEKDS